MTAADRHSRKTWRERTYGSFRITVDGRHLVFHTQPGVFSQDGPDAGSLFLLDVVLPEIKPHHTVLDLGTGVGLIGLSVAGALARGEAWMVDSDIRAIRLAERNRDVNGITNVHIVLSDITVDLPRLRFDLVLSNPPTHSGKDVLASFVGESYEILRPGGSVYLVVNRLLSVRDIMASVFGEAELVDRRKGFLVLRAQKERRNEGGGTYKTKATPQ